MPCTYAINHWVCGNFQAHIKTHITHEEYEVTDDNTLQKTNGESNALKITRSQNYLEINKVLSA